MDLKKLQIILKNYRDELDLIAVAVVDQNGLIIASEMKNMSEDDTIIGATTGSFDSYFNRIKKEYGTQTGFFNITLTDDKKFAYCGAGNEAILTSISQDDVPDIKLKVFSLHIAEKVKKIIAGEENISTEIPEIVRVMGNMKEGVIPKGEFSIKLIITGDFQVGKTSLIKRYIENQFLEDYLSTIGVDISKKTVNLSNDCSIHFVIWDIGGQMSQMTPYRQKFYNGTNSAFIVLDRTRKKTMDSVEKWYNDMKKSIYDIENIPIVLIGNKSDLKDKIIITAEELKNKAKEFGMHFIETSAKTGENVSEAFNYLSYRILERI
jgi:small GTP-binding protein